VNLSEKKGLTMAKKISAPQTSTGGCYAAVLVIRLTSFDVHGCGSASDFHRLPQALPLFTCGRNKPPLEALRKEPLR